MTVPFLAGIIVFLPGVIVLGIVVVLFRGCRRAERELDKYEFQHTTDGGVVQFADFETAERHRKRRNRNRVVANFAQLLFALASLYLIFVGLGVSMMTR